MDYSKVEAFVFLQHPDKKRNATRSVEYQRKVLKLIADTDEGEGQEKGMRYAEG